MQLILDANDIVIKRNMSTIEQESLNEKFTVNKVIEHLTDDISTGNKENIQKQENIISDLGEKDVLDNDDKETESNNTILEKKLSEGNKENDKSDIENVEEKKDNVCEINGFDTDLETVGDDPIILNLIEQESQALENEVNLEQEDSSETKELKEENKNSVTAADSETTLNGSVIKDDDSAKLNKGSDQNNVIEVVESLDLDIVSEQNEVPKLELDKINEETKLTEPQRIDKSVAIEIDDDPEKIIDEKLLSSIEGKKLEDKLKSKNDEVKIMDTSPKVDDKNDIVEIDDEKEKIENNLSKELQELDKEIKNKKEETAIPEIKSPQKEMPTVVVSNEKTKPNRFSKLSNNLDIFSDEEDDVPENPKDETTNVADKKFITIDDCDDIMVIDEDANMKDNKDVESDTITNCDTETVPDKTTTDQHVSTESKQNTEALVEKSTALQITETPEATESTKPAEVPNTAISEKIPEKVQEKETKTSLLPKNFMKSCKKNLADMTRDELEEFCILKIVESIVDRSNLGEIKTQLKNLTQTMDECKKKCLMLSKQNKDLQVVLKSVQEEQKNASDAHFIAPFKITRSVGMQVVMMEKNVRKKILPGVAPASPATVASKPAKVQSPNTKTPKEKNATNQIPVPRLVPAGTTSKSNPVPVVNNPAKPIPNFLPNGVKNPQPVHKMPEKRGRSQSVTVDLTDDEPPAKAVQRALNQSVKVGSPQSIIAAQRFGPNINSPRKVYIPISGPQAQNVRPGQTFMLKTVTGLSQRPRFPTQNAKAPQAPGQVRLGRITPNRHPAPLPEAAKQYQPPNWKSLPPPPDLKLSKVENGIVISWKIDGYLEECHEEIASYQLYAYQESHAPPNSTLWKKIGDVKALPLPMACTLTQFMAGYKYYFAVRAVDVRSRIGPFSSPGSILLLNKI